MDMVGSSCAAMAADEHGSGMQVCAVRTALVQTVRLLDKMKLAWQASWQLEPEGMLLLQSPREPFKGAETRHSEVVGPNGARVRSPAMVLVEELSRGGSALLEEGCANEEVKSAELDVAGIAVLETAVETSCCSEEE
jgi:hypothetical protein